MRIEIQSGAKMMRFSTALSCANINRLAQSACGLSLRDGFAMADGMVRPEGGPSGVADGDAGTGRDRFKRHFDGGGFTRGKIDAAPLELKAGGRIPGGDVADVEDLAVEVLGEGAAEAGLKVNDAGVAAGDAEAGAASPPAIRLLGEETEGGGGIGIDGDRDGDLIAGDHFFARWLTCCWKAVSSSTQKDST